MENIESIILWLCGLPLGAFGLYVFNWWSVKRTTDLANKTQSDANDIQVKTQADTHQIQVNAQALEFYRQFVEQFKADYYRLEKENFTVKEELIKLKAECDCSKHDNT